MISIEHLGTFPPLDTCSHLCVKSVDERRSACICFSGYAGAVVHPRGQLGPLICPACKSLAQLRSSVLTIIACFPNSLSLSAFGSRKTIRSQSQEARSSRAVRIAARQLDCIGRGPGRPSCSVASTAAHPLFVFTLLPWHSCVDNRCSLINTDVAVDLVPPTDSNGTPLAIPAGNCRWNFARLLFA